MPQIWMTYAEIADLLGCDEHEARERAIVEGFDRKKSRDGKTRVKLGLLWVGLFLERIRASAPMDRTIEDLRHAYQQMARDSDESIRKRA